MNKSTFFTLALLCLPIIGFAQNLGVNEDGSSPDASAILDVKSTSKGMLVPRMTTEQRGNIASPAHGLLVFDTATQSFWFYNGSQWEELNGSSATVGDNLGNHTATTNLQTNGNWISN